MIRVFMLFVCMAAGGIFSQVSQFRHYTVNEGLANTTVYYAMQDSKGYLWFCTEAGVNRFNGNTFETFTIKDGLADNENFRCVEDKQGRIWFNSYNGRLCYYNGQSFINERLDPTLSYSSKSNQLIKSLTEDSKGNIWFTGFLCDTDYKYDGKKVWRLPPLVKDPFGITKLFFNKDVAMQALKFTKEALYRENLSDRTTHSVTFKNKVHEQIMNPCLEATGPETFYFQTWQGLRHFARDTVFQDLENEVLGLNTFECIVCFKFSGNDLWIGAANKGLFFIPDFKTKGFTGRFQHYFNPITISSICIDDEGGTWITSLSEGVYYLPRSAGYITNIPGESLTSVKHSSDGSLLATGTYYGRVKVDSSGKTILDFPAGEKTTNRIKAIYWLSDRKLLIGMDARTFILDIITKQKTYPLNDTVYAFGFSDMDQGPAGGWLAGRNTIFLITGTKVKKIYEPAFPSDEKVVALAQQSDSCCWYTSVRELFRLNRYTGTNTKIAGQKIFNSNLKDLLYCNGLLWIATHGNGIFIFKNSKPYAHLYSGNTTITSDICQKLVYYDNKIWVATNKGISVFNAHNFSPVFSLTANDILINNDIRDLDLHDGKAYVAMPSGISIIDVNKFVRQTAPPRIYITALLSGKKNYADSTAKAFSYSRGVITLNYTAITFQSLRAIVYRYKMNVNDSWHETQSDQVEFYDLKPGDYNFMVSAKKYNSTWSITAICSFTVLPLWYQSRWFTLLVLLLVLLVVYFSVYRILKANRKKNETERKMLESELKAIRLHMNPHFIFNTLNSLQLFIFKNRSFEANTYITKFARLIRWIMSYSDKQEIMLAEELEFLKTYVELEQLRFEAPFRFTLNTDSHLNISSTYIPALVIQPFVENAIKYGLSGKKENGELLVTFEKRDTFIFVVVQDNGVGRDRIREEQNASPKETESTGIKYTEERLRLLTENAVAAKPVNIIDLFENGQPTGTRVELIIPILK